MALLFDIHPFYCSEKIKKILISAKLKEKKITEAKKKIPKINQKIQKKNYWVILKMEGKSGGGGGHFQNYQLLPLPFSFIN